MKHREHRSSFHKLAQARPGRLSIRDDKRPRISNRQPPGLARETKPKPPFRVVSWGQTPSFCV